MTDAELTPDIERVLVLLHELKPELFTGEGRSLADIVATYHGPSRRVFSLAFADGTPLYPSERVAT